MKHSVAITIASLWDGAAGFSATFSGEVHVEAPQDVYHAAYRAGLEHWETLHPHERRAGMIVLFYQDFGPVAEGDEHV